MKTYQFRFNNSSKTLTILIWFFTTLVTITLTGTVLVIPSGSYFPTWLLLISLPLMLMAIYKLFKVASKRQSVEVITLSELGFTSSCFGAVLFSDISSIKIPAREISLLGGHKYDYYKQSEANIPNPVVSVTLDNGHILRWVLGEWGGLYNSKEDFSVFFAFLTALTDQLYQLYHSDEPPNSYLQILDENGSWEKKNQYKI
ncbi:hypothetical protein [Chryseobacterium rhizosphaerae]|uniref:hypothetical protein n=1 Tax=Chryseobacterium rhizosphaerae TaxID=395937 RepID=UPI003D0F89E1